MKKLVLMILVNILIIDFASAQIISGTYAIQNIVTNKNLRPYDAGNQNGNRIVSYNHEVWKCMTWEFKHISDSTYQLKNLFTSKSFQGIDNPAKQGKNSNSSHFQVQQLKAGHLSGLPKTRTTYA